MQKSWNQAGQERYRELLHSQMIAGCRWLNILAVTLFPAFAILDFYTQSEHLKSLLLIRFTTTAFFLFTLPFTSKKKYSFSPFSVSLLLLAIASLSITLMCNVLGGFQSPYYAGVNLVVLAAVLVLPIPARRMSVAVVSVIGIYVLGVLAHTGFKAEQLSHFINNIYFLVATGIIGVTAAHLAEQMRIQSFDRYLQLETAQANLQGSRDLLQLELKSKQENVEVLVNELRDRKVELQDALKLRDEFISLASHELNTPLTSLSLQNHIVQKKIESNSLTMEQAQKLFGQYEAQIKRLTRIVDEMLDISRIQAGKLELEKDVVDLEKLTHDLVERTAQRLQQDGQKIEINSEGPVFGEWDGFKIEQVILNLVTNAIKYGNNSLVTITLRQMEDSAIVSVKDRGIGISPENQKRVFEKFERAVHRFEFSGLGLGLYISQQIVKAHGGHITLQSELNQGSEFTVTLPLKT